MRVQARIQHMQLAFGFHGVTVDRVLDFDRRVGVEMPQASPYERRSAHLPHQPVESLRSRTGIGGQECAEPFRQVDQYRTALEDGCDRVCGLIHQRWDFCVGIDADETAAKLIPVENVDQPGVVFGT